MGEVGAKRKNWGSSFFPAERGKIERSETERRKETKSNSGRDGHVRRGAALLGLLSPFFSPCGA
jgi:hypothetical protein